MFSSTGSISFNQIQVNLESIGSNHKSERMNVEQKKNQKASEPSIYRVYVYVCCKQEIIFFYKSFEFIPLSRHPPHPQKKRQKQKKTWKMIEPSVSLF